MADIVTPRLVASDLDGTLLRSDGTVSPVTAAVWRALTSVGVESVMVTARPPRWLDHLTDLVGDHGVAICGNGAFVYDVARREVLHADGFTPAQACEVVRHVTSTHPGVAAAFETNVGMFRAPNFVDIPQHDEENAKHGLPAAAAVATDCELDSVADNVVVGKILFRDPTWRSDEFLEPIKLALGERGTVAFSGALGLAEVSAPGVSKAVALARWCEERGLSARDVWAFGDMPNDIPMLTWAGRGIAVANAHEELKAIADAVCPSNDEDGVALALAERFERLRDVVASVRSR